MRLPLAPRPVPITAALPGPAAGAVDLALVLVSDVSTSVDATEFELQKDGYFAAFTDSTVITAIGAGSAGAIAVAYVEFAGEGDAATVAPWAVLRDAASAHAFAERLRAAPRSFHGRTSISTGLRLAVAELALWGGPPDLRRVIDVCGDGINNSGEPAGVARDAAVAAGATVNGLATINNRPHWPWAAIREQVPGGLPDYYRREVTGGPASFVLVVDDRESFPESVRRKLLQEIS